MNKPLYKIESLPVVKINYYDFDTLVNETFPSIIHKYNFVSQTESSNDTSHSFRITKPYYADQYPADDIDSDQFYCWEKGRRSPDGSPYRPPWPTSLLENLLKKDVFTKEESKSGKSVSINEALFIIEVSW